MDGDHFDRLTRCLHARATRREGMGALLGALGFASAGVSADAQVRSERCLRNGHLCGRQFRKKGKNGNRGAGGKPGKSKARSNGTSLGSCAQQCCTNYARGNRCSCRGHGVACNQRFQCCNAECLKGVCSDTCIRLAGACDPGVDTCCRSGSVCEDGTGSGEPVCCLPDGFPCDDASQCCGGTCNSDLRRCLTPDPG